MKLSNTMPLKKTYTYAERIEKQTNLALEKKNLLVYIMI
jgi:hypothetical protein